MLALSEQLFTLRVPDIDRMSDEELADFLHMRDGRWSLQTKGLLSKFGTTRLNLNRGWAGLWQSWSCPCCERGKLQIPRLSSAGVLLCQIEMHHDHLEDWASKHFLERNPKTADDSNKNLQIDQGKHSMLELIRRFERVPLCLDCNLVEGKAKASLGNDAFRDFSFSPSEIASFITVQDNQVHYFNPAKVREVWFGIKEDVLDRIEFGATLAERFRNGKSRRQVGGQPPPEFWVDSNALFRRILWKNSSMPSSSTIAEKIVARSTARDAVGQSAKPKIRPPGRSPSDEQYAAINLQNSTQKYWVYFGEDWRCACCDRSKRAICRKANSGKWTARIHVTRDWIFSDNLPAFDPSWSGDSLCIDDHHPVFICQDCRHAVSEIQRRDDSLDEDSVTLNDVRASIKAVAANEMHEIDYDSLMDRARENFGLQEAISLYRSLEQAARYHVEQARIVMRQFSCSFDDARDHLVGSRVEFHNESSEKARKMVDWYLERGKRFEELSDVEQCRIASEPKPQS